MMTKDEAKKEVLKACLDLDLYYADKYPMSAVFVTKESNTDKVFDFDHWSCMFDYRDPESVGDDFVTAPYPHYIFMVDDEKGEVVSYIYYTGTLRVEKRNGKYEILGRYGLSE